MNRVVFALGLGLGYVLGARAGRERYVQIQEGARSLAASEPVRRGVAEVQHAVDTATPRARVGARRLADEGGQVAKIAADLVGDGVQKLAGAVTGAAHTARARFTSQAEDLQTRVTLSAEELRKRSEELRAKSTEQIEGLRTKSEELRAKSTEQIDELRSRVDAELERTREASGDQLVKLGAAREEALDVWDDDDDDAEGHEHHAAAAPDDAEAEPENR